ncbi:MAG: pectate lyase [Gammaproteobacteria bacterium]|nr:pectate lyase [Gammaproteobacteria bacterium]
MRTAFVFLALSSLSLSGGCAATQRAPGDVLAFPGAEGYGRHALGGRGGRVIRVTNLDDDGPGSLRDAIQSEGPRTIVFDVSGYIDLASALDIENGFVTIAGQTAPGDGIALRGHSINIRSDHVIVRYVRSRPGASAGVETDAISIYQGSDIIVDHCSASWATDETLSISPSGQGGIRSIDNVTVQWSIIAESLNESVHSKGAHGFGTLVRGSGGARYTMHHNLWAHHRARMPRPGNYVPRNIDPIGPLIDVRSNVFYNWGGDASGYNSDAESVARYSFVGNHYIPGPSTTEGIAFRESNPHARMYFANNWMGGVPVDSPSDVLRLPDGHALEAQDFSHGYVMAPAGLDDFERVLETAGASLSRDAADARVVDDVRARTGAIIDDVSETPGWPPLASSPPRRDSDGDGMPDNWEESVGLDPAYAGDGARDHDGDGYTNLEDYLNSLSPMSQS